LRELKAAHFILLILLKLTAPRVSSRGTNPTPTIDYISRRESVKPARNQHTIDSPVQLYEWRTCSICGKLRPCNAQAARDIADLDQHICSRRRCAKLKRSLEYACSSGTLTVAVHHYYHSGAAPRSEPSPQFVSELPGHTCTIGRAELPGSSGRNLVLHQQGGLGAVSEELLRIRMCTKPPARLVADCLNSFSG
jgi:hypothetical protein